RADDLRRGHFRVVQQENCSERACSSGRKSRLDADGKGEPGEPTRILSREEMILRAWDESDAGGSGQNHAEKNRNEAAVLWFCQGAKRQSAQHQAGHGADYQQTEITSVDLPAEEVERCGDQAQCASEEKRGAHCFAGRKTDKQQQSGNSEAASADSGEADGES